MSLKKKAAQVRAKGKKNIGRDSVLAHITPEEARFLKARGGSGRRDPNTGLPHFDDGDDSLGGGLAGAPDVGTIGGGGYGTPDDGTGVRSDNTYGTGESVGYNNYVDDYTYGGSPYGTTDGFGYGDSDRGGFVDTGGYATPAYEPPEEPISEESIRRGIRAASSLLGPIGQVAVNTGLAATSKNPGKDLGTIGGSILGGALFGPPGAALGGWAGERIFGGGPSRATSFGDRGSVGRGGASTFGGGNAGEGGGFDLGGTLTGLSGLYQGQRAAGSASQAATAAQTQAQQLADLYGPNSPYAQQLREELGRRDAAAGRRSQYGPREVELQARLADVAARNAPNLLAANKQAYEMRGAQGRTRGQQLAGLFDLANKSGFTNWAQRGLSELFSGNTAPTTGRGGYSYEGTAYNNPSAYIAPEMEDTPFTESSYNNPSAYVAPTNTEFWNKWDI